MTWQALQAVLLAWCSAYNEKFDAKEHNREYRLYLCIIFLRCARANALQAGFYNMFRPIMDDEPRLNHGEGESRENSKQARTITRRRGACETCRRRKVRCKSSIASWLDELPLSNYIQVMDISLVLVAR